MRAALVVVTLLFAGCAAAPPPPELPAPTVAASLEFEGCEHVLIFLAIPIEAALAALPEELEPEGFGPGNARGLIMATRCDALGNASGSAFEEAVAALAVEPPADLALEGAPFHLALLALSTTSAEALSRYQAWNATFAEEAPVQMSYAEATASIDATLGGAPLEATLALSPHQAGEAGMLRSFVVVDRQIVGAIDYAWPEYEIATGAAVIAAGAGLLGGSDASAGEGYHEMGEGYGLTLSQWPLPVER